MEAYEGKDAYIFVSYSHKDKKPVLQFVAELQKYCNVWYDVGINAGNEWSDKIADKLANCSLFLFFVSPNSLVSDNCKDELAMARDSGKPFINIRIENVNFEGGMQLRYGRYQFFDLFEHDNLNQAVRQLLKSENFNKMRRKQDMLKDLIARTTTIMSSTEELSLTLNDNNADFWVKFRVTDSTVEFGKYCGTPIIWDIKKVNKNCAYLISKKIIEVMAFDSVTGLYEDSKIRLWLNNDFINSAFDDDEKRLLSPFAVNGQDKVSLLDKHQVATFFPSDEDRIKYGTPYAKNNGLITNSLGCGWWWLSSTDTTASSHVYRIYSNGKLGFDDDFDNSNIGVVPMISVKID